MGTLRAATRRLAAAGAIGMVWGWAQRAEAWVDRVPPPESYRSGLEEYYGGTRSLVMPWSSNVVVFKAGDKQANITGFENAADVEVRDGALCFTAASNTVLLDWGNVGGRQPLKEIESIPAATTHVSLKVRQTGGTTSAWSLVSWSRDGAPVRGRRGAVLDYRPATLAPGAWQDLTLAPEGVRLAGVDADGLGLKLEAEPGARFELAEIRFVEMFHGGYARREFTVPAGPVWRAVVNVGAMNASDALMGMRCELFVNGRRVERTALSVGMYEAQPVDIGPYLQPGTNCIGFHGYRREDAAPFIFASGAVIMESGEAAPLRTDGAWQYSPEAADGWSRPGFAAAGWSTNQVLGQVPLAGFHAKLPAWTGCLQVSQPGRKDLSFRDDQPARILVRIPAGLAARSPAVAFELARSDAYGHCEPAGSGELKEGAREGGSLVFTLEPGLLKAGVYTLALSLRDGAGQVIEERPLEPLMVLRRLTLKEVACRDVKEGLDLERECVIDFTRPDASRPSVEVSRDGGKPAWVTEPRVVTQDGLTYREMDGRSRGSFMSYRVEFKHPGDFYLCEVEYPDNAERCLSVLISKDSAPIIGVGAETGGKFFTTGRMQTLSFLFGAPSGPATLDIQNIQSGWPAAVKSATLYHVKGDLVSAGSGREREFGIHTERDLAVAGAVNGFARSFRPAFLESFSRTNFSALPFMQVHLIKLAALQDVAEKYAQYLKFCGQNTHIMGCYQYSPRNYPFVPFYHERVCSSVVPCIRSVLANTLDANGIAFYAGIEFMEAEGVRSAAHTAAVKKGAESVWVVNSLGEQLFFSPNWLAPDWQREFFRVLQYMDDAFGDLEHYRGVFNMLSPCQGGGYVSGIPAWTDTGWDPLAYSYDDLTFRLFAEDTGLDIGVDPRDPGRFAKRAGLIGVHPMYRDRFLAWRNERLAGFLGEAAGRIRSRRGDLRLVNTIGLEEPQFFGKALESGKPLKEFIKEYGFDIDRLGRVEGVALVRWTVSWTTTGRSTIPGLTLGAQMPEIWVTRENEEYAALLNAFPHRGVLCRTSWDEGVNQAPEPRGDWLKATRMTRSSPQPGAFHAREALIQGLITGDPEYLFTGFVDAALNGGHEQAIREIMRIYTRLPRDTFKTELDTGLNSNLAIRSLSKDGQSWLYAANPGFWAMDGVIAVAAGGKVVNVADGTDAAPGGTVELKVSLAPFGLAAWRVESGDLKVVSVRTGPIGARELSFLRDGIIGRVNALLEDPKVKRVLSPDDRAFMRGVTDQASARLAGNDYAAAWALLKTPMFWRYWKAYLEKAAVMAAFLPEAVTVPARADALALPELTAVKLEGADMQADIVNAPEWRNAPASAEFLTLDGARHTLNQTVVKAGYDEGHLYFGFICADADPGAILAGGADGDVLGIVFQPDADENLYYQLRTNTRGAGSDQRVRAGIVDDAFNTGKEVVCQTYPGYWTALVKAPRAPLGAAGTLARAKANFFREVRGRLLEPAAWSSVPGRKKGRGKIHDQSRWGRVIFQ